ncbi:hypothetical protein KKB18_03535, partial [bacterium]|nr:hypothetical protein [bacterium]
PLSSPHEGFSPLSSPYAGFSPLSSPHEGFSPLSTPHAGFRPLSSPHEGFRPLRSASYIINITNIPTPPFQFQIDPRKPLKNKDSPLGKLEKMRFFQSFSNGFPTLFQHSHSPTMML